MIERKVTVVGDSSVGKTSLANCFCHGRFSEDYSADIGVKIYSKEVQFGEQRIEVQLWDIPPEDEYRRLQMSYFRGASAVLLVTDQSRGYTFKTAENLLKKIQNEFPNLPIILAVNKSDLSESEIDLATLNQIEQRGVTVIHTSAKSGSNVKRALNQAIARH